MAQYSDLDPARLRPSLSDGTDLKPSITTSGYAGGTPAAVTDLKPSICYADGTLKQSIADDTDIKPGLLVAGAARGGYLGQGINDNNIARHLRGENGNGNNPSDDGYYLDSVTLAGGVTTTTVQSYFGTGSIEFDGTDDLITFTGSNELESTSSDCTTWEMWFRPETLSSNRGLWSMVNGTDYIHAYLDSGGSITVAAVLGIPRFSIITAPGTVTANTWHFFRLVRNLTSFELFVDGVSMGTQTDSNTYGGTGWDLNIGQGYSTGFFDGQIDEFLILDQICLGAGRPTAAITPAASYKYQESSDMALWYKFDDGSGSTIADSSGNSKDLTISGTATWGTSDIFLQAGERAKNETVSLSGTKGTVCGWIRYTEDCGDSGGCFGWNNGASATIDDMQFCIYDQRDVTGNSVAFRVTDGGTVAWQMDIPESTININTDFTLHHWVLVHDGVAPKVYLDGAEVTTATFSVTTNKAAWFNNLGLADTIALNAFFRNGAYLVDVADVEYHDIRVYERQLSESEITALYNEGA